MALSPRQSKLVQGAAAVLVQGLELTSPEAVQLIGSALNAELTERGKTLEDLDLASRAQRASFIRAVMQRIEENLHARRLWTHGQVREAVELFMQVLRDSWDQERGD